jgi:prophage antirepressor-like protein
MDKLTVFEQKEIRQIEHNDEIWFSIIDIIEILTGSTKPSNYWDSLKRRDKNLSKNCKKLKFQALDGKFRPSECVNVEGALVIIMSITSPKAHNIKLWIAQAGQEKLENLGSSMTVDTLVQSHAILNNSFLIYEPKTYLMRDTLRGFCKIGKSKNPKIRESTLQAELPTVELLHVIDKDIEAYLHKKFASKRLRGEWFDLSQSDINYIKSY